MKLTLKLTLSFILVILLAIGLAAGVVWMTTAAEFSQYLLDQRQAEFVSVVTEYYQTHGGWQGVDSALRAAGLLPPLPTSGSAQPDPQPFAMADQDRVVIISGWQYQTGQKVKQGILDRGISIEVGGVSVGTVLVTGEVPAPNTIEQKYIDGVNLSLLIAALGGTTLAILLGLFLARSFTRPVRDLIGATRGMAAGQLGQSVPIHSKDELGELANSFNKMSADLARSDLSRRQMTADIAHDLRNPLTVLGGYLESLRDGKLAATPERIATMQDEVSRLQRLVDDLRTLSLADAGDLKLHLQSVTPADLLQRVASTFREQAEVQQINLIVEVQPDLSEVRMDIDRMYQALSNLVSNALRYTPSKGTIRLSATVKKNVLILAVRDNGSGIAPHIQPYIFERSFRGDPSRSGNESGLGLAIVKSIVELHGGSIQVHSQGLGQGSLFKITLPPG